MLFVPQFHKKRFCGGTLFLPHVVSPSIAIMRFFTAMNAVHWTAWLPRHAHNRLETVVEKEIKQSPQQRMSAEGMDPNSMEACGRGAGINDTYRPTSLGLGFLATVIGVFCYGGLVRGFFATVLPGEGFLRQFHGGFLQQSHGGFLRRCRLAGGFLHQSHGGFLHQFSRPDKATLKQQKLQLENFGFSVFPHIPRRIKKLVLVAVVLLP